MIDSPATQSKEHAAALGRECALSPVPNSNDIEWDLLDLNSYSGSEDSGQGSAGIEEVSEVEDESDLVKAEMPSYHSLNAPKESIPGLIGASRGAPTVLIEDNIRRKSSFSPFPDVSLPCSELVGEAKVVRPFSRLTRDPTPGLPIALSRKLEGKEDAAFSLLSAIAVPVSVSKDCLLYTSPSPRDS